MSLTILSVQQGLGFIRKMAILILMRMYSNVYIYLYIVTAFSRGSSLKTTDEIKLPRHRKRRCERLSVGILNHHRSWYRYMYFVIILFHLYQQYIIYIISARLQEYCVCKKHQRQTFRDIYICEYVMCCILIYYYQCEVCYGFLFGSRLIQPRIFNIPYNIPNIIFQLNVHL